MEKIIRSRGRTPRIDEEYSASQPTSTKFHKALCFGAPKSFRLGRFLKSLSLLSRSSTDDWFFVSVEYSWWGSLAIAITDGVVGVAGVAGGQRMSEIGQSKVLSNAICPSAAL
jgi:hypothetical protein